CVYIVKSASLVIELPITLDTAIVLQPIDFAFFNAARVSAVSPDWLIQIISVFSSISGSLYLNSEAISTVTGTEINLSKIGFTARPACIAVPHATIYMFEMPDKYSLEMFKSLKSHFLPETNLVPIVSLIAVGCS